MKFLASFLYLFAFVSLATGYYESLWVRITNTRAQALTDTAARLRMESLARAYATNARNERLACYGTFLAAILVSWIF